MALAFRAPKAKVKFKVLRLKASESTAPYIPIYTQTHTEGRVVEADPGAQPSCSLPHPPAPLVTDPALSVPAQLCGPCPIPLTTGSTTASLTFFLLPLLSLLI